MLVRLTDAWQDILARRAANSETGAYPAPVRQLLGEMAAAGVLMQSNIKFNGALVLQIFGDGPVKVAVAEAIEHRAKRLHGKCELGFQKLESIIEQGFFNVLRICGHG